MASDCEGTFPFLLHFFKKAGPLKSGWDPQEMGVYLIITVYILLLLYTPYYYSMH